MTSAGAHSAIGQKFPDGWDAMKALAPLPGGAGSSLGQVTRHLSRTDEVAFRRIGANRAPIVDRLAALIAGRGRLLLIQRESAQAHQPQCQRLDLHDPGGGIVGEVIQGERLFLTRNGSETLSLKFPEFP